MHVVTGAFGYSGSYIARRLLDAGYEVCTLTNSPDRPNPFGGRVKVFPLSFDDPGRLAESLRGADVLYNTYWVRFDAEDFSHSKAVANTKVLFEVAKSAGVNRVVHTSITNPSERSRLPYFKGKAELEAALKASGLSYAILRPAVLCGKEDILINNIAWMLRKFPVFGVFGDGKYRLQPIFVDDFAKLAIEKGADFKNCTVDAIGPETFTYRELVEVIGKAIGKCRPIISIPPTLGWLGGAIIGKIVGDVVITRDEIDGLMSGLLATGSPPSGATKLSEWVAENAETVGRKYASELARRRDRGSSYGPIG